MKTATIIGHFGFGYEYYDGQTIKTRIVSSELDRHFGENEIIRIDTHGGLKSLIKAPFHIIKSFKQSKNVIILPAHNGLRVYAPLSSIIHKLYKDRKLFYIVIGGWLPKYLENKGILKKNLMNFDCIFVETNSMKIALEKQGFKNVCVMSNCKELVILREEELVYCESDPLKLCTFSRVMKEKGIEDAINAVEIINTRCGKVIYTLDIYGQVDPEQMEWFENLQASLPKYVKYCGVVQFMQSVDVLKRYFALVFPTYYSGEGFAGTIIDAFAAGVPIVASNWKYNREIISNKETGLLFPTHNIDELVNCLMEMMNNKVMVKTMKLNCIAEASKYVPQVAMKSLIDRMG